MDFWFQIGIECTFLLRARTRLQNYLQICTAIYSSVEITIHRLVEFTKSSYRRGLQLFSPQSGTQLKHNLQHKQEHVTLETTRCKAVQFISIRMGTQPILPLALHQRGISNAAAKTGSNHHEIQAHDA